MILCLAALGLLCWPSRPALRRLGACGASLSMPATASTHTNSALTRRLFLTRQLPPTRRVRDRADGPADRRIVAVGVLAVAGLALAAGPAASIAALLIATTVAGMTTAELRRRRERRQIGVLLVATRTLAREVRTGSSPMAAVLATAAAHPGCAPALDQLAMAVVGARGDPAVVADTGRRDQQVEVIARLGEGWQLSARHGVPWAALIDTVAADLDDRQKAESSRTAQVAGPRVSGYVLAVMPALGILLGAGMGADPVHVLLHTAVGSVLLLIGTALTCLGLAWTASIVRA